MRALVLGVVAVVGVGMMSGCVTKWKYDEEVEKNEHLMSVKTEQDIERDGLHADVNALHRAYTQQSMRMTAMEGVVTQTTAELRSIQSRLTTMNQDLAQQRSDVAKISQQATETLQLLRVLNEQQQVNALTLTQLSGKVDAVKTAATARAARASAPTPAKEKESDMPNVKSDSDKSAVERAMEQQMGMGPRPAPPLAARPSPTPATSHPATDPIPAVAPLPSPAHPVVSGPAPATAGDKVLPPSAAISSTSPPVVPSPVASPERVTPAEPIKKVEDELSPLQRTGLEKAEQKPKQTWREWAREKIFGKSPVQTAAKNTQPASPPAEKR
ncbi:MAG: hypothetical protein KGO23_06070 [Nitrospirota bacterium]|nr:hypothetical protein [Nitrospirota bacterium]